MPKSVDVETGMSGDLSDAEGWSDDERDTPEPSVNAARPQGGPPMPRWRAIEEYGEQQRLRDLINDFLHDEK